MNTPSLSTINKLADERLRLYEQASEHALTPEQRARITEITDRLPGLWDQYRREVAAEHNPAIRLSGSERLQKAVVAGWDRDDKARKAA